MLVAGVLLERGTLGRRLEVLEADLALDALGGEVLRVFVSLLLGMETFSHFRVAQFRKQGKEETYGFELRFGDRARILLALTLGGCLCAVAHGC